MMRLFIMCLLLRIGSIFSKKMFVTKAQKINMNSKTIIPSPILDLGGGGEGIIGQLFGNHVTAIDLYQEELDEAPNGPIKVIGDARNLPFGDATFVSITAFYFFMYTNTIDHLRIFQEVYRVLRAGETFMIWDTEISPQGRQNRNLFVVPVEVEMPNKKIQTAYGTPWKDRIQTRELFRALGVETGFEVIEGSQDRKAFYQGFRKK
ncbi:MAG: class I SAM-dependent methyltransferase [Candidatus Izemoplasmatales bacterium]|nr:class I SAM-dependent methyltransferase [Candidatus Izemoplasmatales bacterium]